jgi:predicted nucleotidyltransferase
VNLHVSGTKAASEVRPTLETSKVSKRKWKNLARLKRRKAKALAEQLMTAPVEASVTTVQPSATVIEDAQIAVVEAAISDTSAKLVEGLVEGYLYQLINGRFVECKPTHSGLV